MKNIKKIVGITYLFLLAISINSCSDFDDLLNAEPIGSTIEKLYKRDSELIKLIDKVVTKTNNSAIEIVCVDFVYPFKIFLYDANFNVIGEQVLVGDANFSAFLASLDPNQAISISYPIKTTLLNGTVFTVNNNAELKIALENCSNEDIISYYSNLFSGGANGTQSNCVWTIPYKENFSNKYASGVFEANNNGTIKFNYEGTVYAGTWTFLFVNAEFQMNISLAGTSAVAQDWRFSRKIIYEENQITIENSPKKIVIEKKCEATAVYPLGTAGPAGGIVFYDKGFYSLGWRYLEAAPADLGLFEWGCSGTLIQNTDINIGKGLVNSAKIANFHDNLLNFYLNPSVCNVANNGSVVAQKALLYSNQEYKDWYLPSEKELNLMYLNLKTLNLGNFTNDIYWSSTEVDANLVKAINFTSGNIVSTSKIPSVNNVKGRAIRNF